MTLRTTIDESLTLYQVVSETADRFPEREALIVVDQRLTYRGLAQRLDALAAGLQRLGLEKGDRVAVILPPSPESVYTLVAPGKVGLIIVPMNPLLRAQEVRHILADSGAVALITVPKMYGFDYLNMVEAIRPTLPALRHVIVSGESSPEGMISLAAVMAQGEAGLSKEVEVGPDDSLGFFYTSGTTGLPKGAVHTHRNLLGTLSAALEISRPDDLRSVMTPLPLFHYAGVLTALEVLCIGGKLTVQERFIPQQALALLAREQARIMIGVPTMYRMMLQVPDFEQYDLSALVGLTTGAAPCPPELVQAIETRTPAKMGNAYGLTEVGIASLIRRGDSDEALRTSTVGRPPPRGELRIVDDQRHQVPVGQPGEVSVRSPYVFKGYHNHPEATAAVLDEEGWFYTGDVGFLDEPGYLHLVDRKKDVVIRGGENVYPSEVEHFLLAHPAVHMAAVVGVPSSVGGERLWAYIVPQRGTEPTASDIIDACRGQIAPHKIPDEVRFVPDLPMTATGKVQKFTLRERAQQELSQA